MLPPHDHIWISDDFPGHQMHSAGQLHQTAVPVAAQQYTTLNSETCPQTVWKRDMFSCTDTPRFERYLRSEMSNAVWNLLHILLIVRMYVCKRGPS